jgi:penicillin-binding protein 1A
VPRFRLCALTSGSVALGLAALSATLGACSYTTASLEPARSVTRQSSKILAADGTELTTLHGGENRETVALADIPQVLRDAVVAIEDERFWDHPGIDIKAMLRAAYEDTSQGKIVQGGSTITQQYVKNAMLDSDRTVKRKVREAALAYQLERNVTKEQILERYLNTIYFGNSAYGVQAAAATYFNRPVKELDLAQATVLAGIIRAPALYDPFRYPEAAQARRDDVLDKMVSLGWLDTGQADLVEASPVSVVPPDDGNRYLAAYFVEEVKLQLLKDPVYGAGETEPERVAAVFGGGLRVHTTLDLRRQLLAEDAVARVLSEPNRDPSAAVVSIDPRTGFVEAMVGGRDFFGAGPHDKLNLATQARRQAGSSFKPIVLAAALEGGVALSRTYRSPARMEIPLTGQPPWKVRNYDDVGGGRLNLVEATVSSSNTVYAQLIMEVGPANAMALARRMGITTALEPYPAAVLGTNDVTPLDMASAYSTLAARGVHVPPVLITKVTKADGTVLYQHQHHEDRVLPEAVVDAEVPVLEQVVRRGTGVNARIGRPVAGKTGTTEKWNDAWFVGFTPELVTSVWVGFPGQQLSMVPPWTRVRVTGGSWPAQIWQLYTSAALADAPVTPFPVPKSAPATAPSKGSPFPPGTIVKDVASVVGMVAALAEDTLARDGWMVVRKDVPNGDYPPGYVVAQSPCAGCQAVAAGKVTISVSKGAADLAVVPNVLGLTADEARLLLADSDLAATVLVRQEPPAAGASGRRGLVWKQNPPADAAADRGATVTVYVNPP